MSHIGRAAAACGLAAALWAGGVPGPGGRARADEWKPPADAEIVRSPLTLETPFTAADPANLGKWVETAALREKGCDGVFLELLASRARAMKAGDTEITLKVTTFTIEGRDKAVRVSFELLSGSGTIGRAVIEKIDAEEEKNGRGTAWMTLPAGRLPEDAPLTLRVTLDVVND